MYQNYKISDCSKKRFKTRHNNHYNQNVMLCSKNVMLCNKSTVETISQLFDRILKADPDNKSLLMKMSHLHECDVRIACFEALTKGSKHRHNVDKILRASGY